MANDVRLRKLLGSKGVATFKSSSNQVGVVYIRRGCCVHVCESVQYVFTHKVGEVHESEYTT